MRISDWSSDVCSSDLGRQAGELAITGTLHSPEDWTFAYHDDYLASDTPVALSVALRLSAAPYAGAVVSNWICKLSPDGAVRGAIPDRRRIPERDDHALFSAEIARASGRERQYQ